MSEINWERLRRDAEREYAGEARRRQELGSNATAAAEELAWWVKNGPDAAPVPVGPRGPDAMRAAALAADQAVYVYCRGILVAKLEPSTIWNASEGPDGLHLETLLYSRSRNNYMPGPTWAPGEWTFCGRGHEGR